MSSMTRHPPSGSNLSPRVVANIEQALHSLDDVATEKELEICLGGLCRHLGFEYKQMESEDDSLIVVVEAHCRYKQPARFDELLTIRTRVTGSKRRMLEFGYEIIRQSSDETIATGRTLHVICDHQGRPKSLPEKYRKYFPVTGLTRDQTLSL